MPAHEGGNPILPRRDRAMQAEKSRNPPVPRAPRAKARSNSCGLLAREMKKDSRNSSANSIGSRMSESRRPAAESPFTYARVNSLLREKESVENQVFEMGPRIRSSSVDHRRDNHERGHWLGKEHAVNQGMPWSQPKEEDESQLPKARRRVLHHEQRAADQALEWVPKEAMSSAPRGDNESDLRSHARVNICKREVLGANQTLEMAPMVQVSHMPSASAAAVGPQYHGRRNVMARETAEESNDAPLASGMADEGVPTYGRKNMLPPYVPRAAAAY